MEAAPFCIPISNAWGFQFFTSLPTFVVFCFTLCSLFLQLLTFITPDQNISTVGQSFCPCSLPHPLLPVIVLTHEAFSNDCVEWRTNRVVSQLYQDGCSDDRRVKEIRLLTPHCFHYFVKGLTQESWGLVSTSWCLQPASAYLGGLVWVIWAAFLYNPFTK